MRMIVQTLALLLFSSFAFGQNEGVEPSKEMKQFALIYLLEKEIPHSPMTVRTLLAEHQVTEERYGEMIRARVANKDVTFTPGETALLASVDSLNHAEEIRHREKVMLLCQEHALAYDRYVELKTRFRTDITFQHLLKPIFDELLKEQR